MNNNHVPESPLGQQLDRELIVEEKTRLLYMQAPAANVMSIIVVALIYFMLRYRVDLTYISYWAPVLLLSAFYRLSLCYRRQKNPSQKTAQSWLNHYLVGCAMMGVAWGLLPPLLYGNSDPVVMAALSMVLFGVAGAAVSVLSAHMPAFIVYTYPQLIVFIFILLRLEQTTYHWLAAGLFFYLVLVTLFTRNIHNSILRSIHYQARNDELIAELNSEISQRNTLIEERTEQLREKNEALLAEVHERKLTEAFQLKQNHILELISRGTSTLPELLNEITQLTESQDADIRASVLLLEGTRLRFGAAPDLPKIYIELIDGLEIGPDSDSCWAAAVYRKERIIVEDVNTDPAWGGCCELGSQLGFRSCWSEPIVASNETVLGTFAIYHTQPKAPDEHEIYLIEAMAHIAGIAIEKAQSEQRLRQSAAVFKSTVEGVIITDHEERIVDVNRAFETITGYQREEIIGQTPRILKSERHDMSFYRDMWKSLADTGQWRGEVWNRRKNGEVYPEWLNISSITDGSGALTNYVAVFSDITSIKRSEEELDHLAHHDALTDLPNRLLFNSRLKQAIKHARREGSVLAVLFVDLDRFKNINDSMGHSAGDSLLQQLAVRLKGVLRLDDSVARISGDEFVILLEQIGDSENTAIAVEKIMKVFKDPFQLDGHQISITASIGISLYPVNGEDASTLLRHADAAMYRAKNEGRNSYQFYTREMTSSAFERVVMENALRGALEREEFRLAYQPQIQLQSGELTGLEALIRWHHPELGVVSPAKFIPLAEDTGLIHDIGIWVMQAACRQGKEWLDKGYDFGRIAVNVARPQLQRSDFLDTVKKALELSGLSAVNLELEVTERSVVENTEQAVQQLKALGAMGLRLSIDDFGTGYSSMSYLKLLPIHKLKIDQSFVRDIPIDRNDMAISEAIIALGHALDLHVIAEGVETEQQAEFLSEKGCKEGQGYLYCKPLPAEEIEALYFSG
jgi:diguanylate cyclase (GGDEF)-like protein/PAS domain S-box-containing protein